MRRVRLLGIITAVVAGCLLLLYGGKRLHEWFAAKQLRHAYASLQRCLLGTVTVDGAEAARRLRGAQLSAAVDSAQRSWPRRCRGAVEETRIGVGRKLQDSWDVCGAGECCAGDSHCRDLEQLSLQLAAAAAFAQIGESSLFDVEVTTRLAVRLGLDGGIPSSEISGAPAAPSTLLDPRAMVPMYRGNYLRLLTDPGGTQGVDLLFYDHQRRYGLCRTQLSAVVAARCRVLPAHIPVGMAGELLAAAPDAPQLLYAQGPRGDNWLEALYNVDDGRHVETLSGRPLGGFVWTAGLYARLADTPPLAKATLFRMRDDQLEALASLASERISSGPFVLYDQVVWAESSAAGWHNVKVQPIQRIGEPLGPPKVVGGIQAPGAKLGFDLCRTETGVALLSAHLRGDAVAGMLSFRTAGGNWRAPLSLAIGSRRFGFTCRDETATFSWVVAHHERPEDGFIGEVVDGVDAPVSGRYAVHRLRCSAAGCEERSVRVALSRYAKSSRYVAGDVGDAMVLLWRSPLGDVRMRLAALSALPDAPDVVLFDDVEHDGFGWDLERDPIFGRADKVLLLLSRQQQGSEESETYGIVLDDKGGVTPVPVRGM